MNTNLPPFYVGQKVVYVATDDLKRIATGSQWTVIRIMLAKCDCWLIDIGLNTPATGLFCYKHIFIVSSDGTLWSLANHFVPIEQTFQSISFEKVVEIESPLIGIN